MTSQFHHDGVSGAGESTARHFPTTLLVLLTLGLACGQAGAWSVFDDDWAPPAHSETGPAKLAPLPPPTVPAPAPDANGATPVAPPAVRRAIPAKADAAPSRKLMLQIFAAELADRTPHGRQVLAFKLLAEEPKYNTNPVDQFVVLTGAIQAAKEGGDLPACFRAVDLLAANFRVDATSIKADSAIKMSRTAYAVNASRNVTAALEVIDQLASVEDFSTAARLASVLQPAAGADAALSRQVQQRRREIDLQRASRDRLAAQLEKLKTSPDDPTANLAVGNYYCISCDRWDVGLPMLAKGSDATLKGLATAELDKSASAETLARLGDAWWDMSAKQTGGNRVRICGHAAVLYSQAVTGITGLRQTLMQRRIAEAAALNPTMKLVETPRVNLLKNGDFAAGSDEAEHWVFRHEGDAGKIAITRDTKEFAVGPASVCLSIEEGPVTGRADQYIEVPDEGTLHITGILKTSADYKGRAEIILQRNAETGGAVCWKTLASASKFHEWTPFSVDVSLPIKGVKKAELNVWAQGTQGKFWADELHVDYIPPAHAAGADAGPQPLNGAAASHSVLWFNGNGAEGEPFKAISNGKMKTISKADVATALADPKLYSDVNIAVWGVNRWRDTPAEVLNARAQQALQQFVRNGGDLVMFEQYAQGNMDIIDHLFGIKTSGGAGLGTEVVLPELKTRLAQAGYTDESLKAITFFNSYDNVPANATVLVRGPTGRNTAVVAPYGKGRLILIGTNLDRADRKLDEEILDLLYHWKSK